MANLGRRKVDRVDVERIKQLANQLLLVGRVENAEIRLEADDLGPFAEQAGTETVKRADPNTRLR